MADGGRAANPAAVGAALVGAVFILPFLVFSGHAGHLADAQSKQRVLVWTKGLEVGGMAMVTAALVAAQASLARPALAVLFLMATQSASSRRCRASCAWQARPPCRSARIAL